MLCNLDQNQKLSFKTPLSDVASVLLDEAQRVIAFAMRDHTESAQNPMSSLHQAALNCVEHFHDPAHWTRQRFELKASLISEYDRSVDELKDYFSYSKNPAVFASLYKNKIEFKELNLSMLQKGMRALSNYDAACLIC